MSNEDEIPDEQALPDDGQQAGAPETEESLDDIDRLVNDPAHFAKVNETLVRNAAGETTTGEAEGKQDQPPAAPAQARTEQAGMDSDPDPVVETIDYRGQLIPVRKSEQRSLMQKGKSLEFALRQLAPLRIIADDGELMALAHKIQRLPKGKEALKAAMRTAFETALPEVEGYSKEDVVNASRLLRPLLESEGIVPGASAGGPGALEEGSEGQPLSPRDEAKIEAHLVAAVSTMPREEAIETLNFVSTAILEADRLALSGALKAPDGSVITPEQWREVRAAINDPRTPENFHRFFSEMHGQLRAQKSAARKVKIKSGTLPAGGNQDRLGGGAAGTSGKAERRTADDLSDEEFEKLLVSI